MSLTFGCWASNNSPGFPSVSFHFSGIQMICEGTSFKTLLKLNRISFFFSPPFSYQPFFVCRFSDKSWVSQKSVFFPQISGHTNNIIFFCASQSFFNDYFFPNLFEKIDYFTLKYWFATFEMMPLVHKLNFLNKKVLQHQIGRIRFSKARVLITICIWQRFREP